MTCIAEIVRCSCLFSPADGCSLLRLTAQALRRGRKRRQILKGMYLEIIAIVKNLSSLLIALPSGVKPKLETLTFVTTCLRLLDCLKHKSAQSAWPNSYSFWCSSCKIPSRIRNVGDMDFLDISIVLWRSASPFPWRKVRRVVFVRHYRGNTFEKVFPCHVFTLTNGVFKNSIVLLP